MSFEKIGQFAATVVIAAALVGHSDSLNHWVQVATAKLVWESRTAKWGSPHFFQENYSGTTKAAPPNRSTHQKLKTDHKIHSESRSN